MAQAVKRLPPPTGPGNGEPPADRLSAHEAATRIVGLINSRPVNPMAP